MTQRTRNPSSTVHSNITKNSNTSNITVNQIPLTMHPEYSTCVPTERSSELFIKLLTVYPTLESLLSVSHRSDITHLARTCKTIRKILTCSVGKLVHPFQSCPQELGQCYLCNTGVCKECVVDARERASGSTRMEALGWTDPSIQAGYCGGAAKGTSKNHTPTHGYGAPNQTP